MMKAVRSMEEAGLMTKEDMLKKLKRVDELPTLPAVAMKLNRLLQKEETNVQDVTAIIEKDQVMVPKILRLVNSAFFGLKRTVNSLNHAVMMLGFNTLRSAVVTVSIIEALSSQKELKGLDMSTFWTHSIAVGMTCQSLASQTRLLPPEDAFNTGLLHDVGKVILCKFFPDAFAQVWSACQDDPLGFYEAEKANIPLNHTQMGSFLIKTWGLSSDLHQSTRWHHEPHKHVDNVDMLMVVHAADKLVNQCLDEPGRRFKLSAIHPDAAETLRGPLSSTQNWFPALVVEIEKASNFLLEEL
jgi:HD-like signal output (HDOD) protein